MSFAILASLKKTDIVKRLISVPDMLSLEKLDINPFYLIYKIFITLFLYDPNPKLSAVFLLSTMNLTEFININHVCKGDKS